MVTYATKLVPARLHGACALCQKKIMLSLLMLFTLHLTCTVRVCWSDKTKNNINKEASYISTVSADTQRHWSGQILHDNTATGILSIKPRFNTTDGSMECGINVGYSNMRRLTADWIHTAIDRPRCVHAGPGTGYQLTNHATDFCGTGWCLICRNNSHPV